MKRVDWIAAVIWLALLTTSMVIGYVVGGVILWLGQRALMFVVWPFVQANADRLISAVLVGVIFGLAAKALRGEQ